jgi:hypothetical protein
VNVSQRMIGLARSDMRICNFISAGRISARSLKVADYIAVTGKSSGSATGEPVATKNEPEDD